MIVGATIFDRGPEEIFSNSLFLAFFSFPAFSGEGKKGKKLLISFSIYPFIRYISNGTITVELDRSLNLKKKSMLSYKKG